MTLEDVKNKVYETGTALHPVSVEDSKTLGRILSGMKILDADLIGIISPDPAVGADDLVLFLQSDDGRLHSFDIAALSSSAGDDGCGIKFFMESFN